MTAYRLLEMIRNAVREVYPNNESQFFEDRQILNRQSVALQEVINLHSPQKFTQRERTAEGMKVKTIRSTCLECLEQYPCNTIMRINGKLGTFTQNAVTTPYMKVTVESDDLRVTYQSDKKFLTLLDWDEIDAIMIDTLNAVNDKYGEELWGLTIEVSVHDPDQHWDRILMAPYGTAAGPKKMVQIMHEVDERIQEAFDKTINSKS